MRSRKLVAAVLILAAAGFVQEPWAEASDATPTERELELAERLSRLEAALAAEDDADPDRLGEKLYFRACAACHGRLGEGDGPAAAELVPWPSDFKTGKYRIRSSLSGEAPLRSDIEGTVRRGMPGTAMPKFEGVLSDEEITAVVSYILTLGPPSLTAREPQALSIPDFPEPGPASLADGRAVYLILGCWKCHGLKGSGKGPSAKGLKTDEGQPIRPRDFRYEPFKAGRSYETVARAALSGLIGTPMPSHAEIMVIPHEAIDAFAESIPEQARPDLADYRREAIPAAELMELEDDAWQVMRDRNLVSLAHYVLSLSRRGRLDHWLFRQDPETEGR